jgi:hypothetical protein
MSERVMGRKGFFDVERRLEAISALGDPLETIKKIVPWEDFRTDMSNLLKREITITASGIGVFRLKRLTVAHLRALGKLFPAELPLSTVYEIRLLRGLGSLSDFRALPRCAMIGLAHCMFKRSSTEGAERSGFAAFFRC